MQKKFASRPAKAVIYRENDDLGVYAEKNCCQVLDLR